MAGMMGGANHLGMGEKPSEFHRWIPGIGWLFTPTYEEGWGAGEQGLANQKAGGVQGYKHALTPEAQAVADKLGITYETREGASGLTSPNIRARQASHALYEQGADHWGGSTDDEDWALALNNWNWDRKGSPQMSMIGNVFVQDRENTFNRFMMDEYNPFVGHEGSWVGGENTGYSIASEEYSDDSIAAWFKNAFAGEDMIDHRRDALDTLGAWNHPERWKDPIEGSGTGINRNLKRMNKRYFDEMGLAEKFGLEWVDPRQEQIDAVNNAITGGGSTGGSTGGFMSGYNGTRPPPLTGGARPSGPRTGGARPSGPPMDPNDYVVPPAISQPPQVKPGGFMESYLKKKAETKPSVMSLMTELKDA